eukprot:PLAT6474.3.p1 GENE.PLAT6474.3~~PLAT6474.3.p1  ORF type:complete len:499 (+),score=120.64 PLAT6474.3:151-1497(+)
MEGLRKSWERGLRRGKDGVLSERPPERERRYCGLVEGQYLSHARGVPLTTELPGGKRLDPCRDGVWHYVMYHRPAWLASTLPIIVTLAWWVPLMEHVSGWHMFRTNYFMSVTMLFGSLIAGGTSEGGASVAFPVMTLIFKIPPHVARDFSLMIQSIGMTAAAFTILYMGVVYERTAVVWSNLGGLFGITLGLYFVAPYVSPPNVKMLFVSVWLAFAMSLYLLNRMKNRVVYLQIPRFGPWQAMTLVATGFIGGVITSLTGTGIDICTFAILTLFFRVSEKTATPTSILIMSINTLWGFVVQGFFRGLPPLVWPYWFCSVPVVVMGAPLGAYISSFLHRSVYAGIIYVMDFVQFIAAVLIVPQDETTVMISCFALVIGSLIFYGLRVAGERISHRVDAMERSMLLEDRTSSELSVPRLSSEEYDDKDPVLAKLKARSASAPGAYLVLDD